MNGEHTLEFRGGDLEHCEQHFGGGVFRRCTLVNDHFYGVVGHLGAEDMSADGEARVVREAKVKDCKARQLVGFQLCTEIV